MLAKLKKELSADPTFVHLNNAGVSPMLNAATEAVAEVCQMHSRGGFHSIPDLIERYEAARIVHARLLGTEAENVAFFQTCASAISQVAFGLSFSPGDEILTWAEEYSSNAYPWHEAASRTGARVKVLPVEKDYSVVTEKLIQEITNKTKVVAVSWVQFQTGAMTDLKLVAETCKAHDAWLVVDAIQGLGVIPFDMTELGVDAVCGGTHKWLLGPLGHGFLGLAPHRRESLNPIALGAVSYGFPGDPTDTALGIRSDIHRYEPGSPLLLGSIGAAASMKLLLDIGIENINNEATLMADKLRDKVLELGADVLSPSLKGFRSPILTFRTSVDVAILSKQLDARRISHSIRAGGIRLAPHAFTSTEDLEAVCDVLSSCLH